MPKLLVAIDPGMKGGVAFRAGTYTGHFSLVLEELRTRLKAWKEEWEVLVYIEKQWLWKNERDVKTADKLICNFCMIKGMLFQLDIPWVEIPPRTWQSDVLGVGGDTKKKSLKFVLDQYDLDTKDDGIADALALLHYACSQENL